MRTKHLYSHDYQLISTCHGQSELRKCSFCRKYEKKVDMVNNFCCQTCKPLLEQQIKDKKVIMA